MTPEEQLEANCADALASATAREWHELEAARLEAGARELQAAALARVMGELSERVSEDNKRRKRYGAPGAQFSLPDEEQTFEDRVRELAAIEMELTAIGWCRSQLHPARKRLEAAEAAYQAALAGEGSDHA